MKRPVRLRFAPSPTGALHIGGIRTALYNYLFTKKHQGQFILRIEDTDQGRYVPGAEEYIIQSLEWVGLIPDEGPSFGGEYGPYRQSERKEIYKEYAQLLIERKEAYYAFDTTEELDALRKEEEGHQKYDYNTRNRMKNSLTLSVEESTQLIQSGTPYVIRLKVPEHQTIIVQDIIRGTVQFNTSELDDKVLVKSDGMPTYHMANVVDDYLMKISHVIRGEEWLSSTAHHVLLYKAFGWENEMPEFAHLPLILKPSGNGKLSKRDGALFGFPVFPISWKVSADQDYQGFREYGFEPEALLNFLAFLGWNPGTEQELFNLEELIHAFSLEHIVKSGARFDFEKGKWFNQQYAQRLSEDRVIKRIKEDFIKEGLQISEHDLHFMYLLYKDRILFVKDFVSMTKVYFIEDIPYDTSYIDKKFKPEFISIFQSLTNLMNGLNEWISLSIEEKLKEFIATGVIKPGELFPSLRIAMTGIPSGPDVFKMMEFCGKEKFIHRLQKLIQFLEVK